MEGIVRVQKGTGSVIVLVPAKQDDVVGVRALKLGQKVTVKPAETGGKEKVIE